MDRLLGQFFNYSKNSGENIATHVAKIQSIFHELNDEMQRLEKVRLPDVVFMSRIMSTLPAEYFEFQSVWESIPHETRTVIFSRNDFDSSKLGCRLTMKRNRQRLQQKLKRRATLRRKQIRKVTLKKAFKCFKCHKTGHIAKQCKQKDSDKKPTDPSTKEIGEAFICELERIPDSDIWLADTGCTEHMTPNEKIFHTYTRFMVPKIVRVGNNEPIEAVGYGTVIVEMLIDGTWKTNHLKVVWHVPELVRNLFSVTSTLQKGFKFIADGKECQIIKNNRIYIVGQTINKLLRFTDY